MPREGAGFIMFSTVSGVAPPAGTGQRLPGAGNDYPLDRAGIFGWRAGSLGESMQKTLLFRGFEEPVTSPCVLACPLRCISRGLKST
jgi:hypothetical protein